MNPVTFLAKNYSSRSELDTDVRNLVGDDISANRLAGHFISGTSDELKALYLSISSSVFGVKVVLLNN